MDDLRIPAGPGCPRGLVVPAGELVERFSHASGPGGQGVNTADSRVQLSLDLAATVALNDKQRERAMSVLGDRLSETVLTVTAAEHRSQRRNRAAARERLAEALRSALVPPVPRRATKPPRRQKEALGGQGAQAPPGRGLRKTRPVLPMPIRSRRCASR